MIKKYQKIKTKLKLNYMISMRKINIKIYSNKQALSQDFSQIKKKVKLQKLR